jgi:Gluconate 2-dehydrogenase subunit 3
MRGRYPQYDVLATTEHWDAKTRSVVLDRVANVPPIRFFDEREVRTLRAFCDVVMGQDCEPRIPVLEMVDAKLYDGRLDGFRYDDMPPDPQTWREVAANLDDSARTVGAREGFAGASSELQREIVGRFSKGELDWDIPVARAWGVVMRMVLAAFYSHPWAWNEIGFAGPAYPRGFVRLAEGQREHWERASEPASAPMGEAPDRGRR